MGAAIAGILTAFFVTVGLVWHGNYKLEQCQATWYKKGFTAVQYDYSNGCVVTFPDGSKRIAENLRPQDMPK